MPDTITPDLARPGPAPSAPAGTVQVQAAPAMARVILRGDPAALGAAFGVTLPVQPCRAASAGGRTALWLGPDEWLLLAQPGTLDAGMAAEGGAVVDVSHRQVGLQLHGPGVAEVLAAGCPLDLHPRSFPPGTCTRTVFGKAEIVLWRLGPDEFHVEVWRSFRGYVAALLEQGVRGSGMSGSDSSI